MKVSIHHRGRTIAATGVGPDPAYVVIRLRLGGWLSFLVLTFDVEVQS